MKRDDYINDILVIHRKIAEKAKKPFDGLKALSLYRDLQIMDMKTLEELWIVTKELERNSITSHYIGIDASCLVKKVAQHG